MKKRLLVTGLVLAFLSLYLHTGRVAAASYDGVATPSATAYGANVLAFQPDAAPVGNWTSTTTTTSEGRAAAYMMPPLIGTCDVASVTSLIATIQTTAISLAPGTSQGLTGVMMRFVDSTDPSLIPTSLPLTSVLSGAMWVPDNNQVARGVTNGMFTTTPTPIPGEISIQLSTTGMTVADYNRVAISVHHDLLDGPFGFINSVTSSQPIVQVQTDDTACNPVIPTPPPPTNGTVIGSVETLADTGADYDLMSLGASVTVLLGCLILASLARRHFAIYQ